MVGGDEMDKLEKFTAKVVLYTLFSPFLIVWWFITAGSSIGVGLMKVTGAKPYRGGRR